MQRLSTLPKLLVLVLAYILIVYSAKTVDNLFNLKNLDSRRTTDYGAYNAATPRSKHGSVSPLDAKGNPTSK